MATRIYTKTGDKGQTGLIGGTRVAKNHIRIEAYGTVDELNSWMGLLRDNLPEEKNTIIEIQDRLFTIGALLATDPDKNKMKLPELAEQDVLFLENQIDKMEANLPPMKNFVLPGGNTIVSYTHIARCVCRRAERCTISLAQHAPVADLVVKYLNRLSDYLFVLSRHITHILSAEEIPWKPRT
jgi:cob(I)alamin adenosyltransferase